MVKSFLRSYHVAYICFHEKKQEVVTIPIRDEVVIDMAPDSTIYGIELLNANRQLRHAAASNLLVIKEATGEQIDLPLA